MYISTYCIVYTLFAGLFTKLMSIFVYIHAVVIICVCQIFIKETACLLVYIDASKWIILETAIFEYQFIIANISMTVRRIISKSRRFIEIWCLFMLLNDN